MKTAEYWKEKKGFFPDGRKLKLLICKANDGGCAFYRAIDPYRKLGELYSNVVEIKWSDNPLDIRPDPDNNQRMKYNLEHDHADMKWADVVFFHNIHKFGGPYTTRICGMTKEFGKVAHYDTDDLLTELYKDHRLVDVYNKGGLSDMTKFIYHHSDIVTVTQKSFAERVAPFCRNNLSIVMNAIDYNLPGWNLKKQPPPRKNLCRIGWAAGIHHEADVKEFAGVPWLVNQKVGLENVFWGFYGHPPLPKPSEKSDWQHEVWKNYRKALTAGMKGQRNWDIYLALPPDQYGAIYTNIDISIAPLQDNNFNRSKSNIKISECGRYSIPLIASDVGCYNEIIKNGETGYLLPPNASKSEWVSVLSKVIKDKKHREEMGANLNKITDEYFDLNKVVHYRLNLYADYFNL